MPDRQNGFALASILLLAMVAIVVALTVAALGSAHLALAQSVSSDRAALYMADALVQEVAGRIEANRKYAGALTFPAGSPPDEQALVTFDPAVSPHCTNNWDGLQNLGFGGVVVPQGMIHVVAQGRCGRSLRTVEAMLAAPLYPYALSAAGNVSLSTTTTVGASQSMAQYANPPTIPGVAASLLPASVGAVGTLTTTSPVTIQGDAVGSTVSLFAGSHVGGTVRVGQPVDVPRLNITGYRPPGPITALPVPSPDVTLDSSQAFLTGPLSLPGNLILNEAVLYVDGDLDVAGGISGHGAIFVNGKTTIHDGVVLAQGNMVALLTNGDVTLTGSGNFFQGLVYSEGVFTASQITLVGVFVGGRTGSLSLGAGVQVVGAPDAAIVDVQTSPLANHWTWYGIMDNQSGSPVGPMGPLPAFDTLDNEAPASAGWPGAMGIYGPPVMLTPHAPADEPSLVAALDVAMGAGRHAATWGAYRTNPWDPFGGHQLSLTQLRANPSLEIMVEALHFDARLQRWAMWETPNVFFWKTPLGVIPQSQFDTAAQAEGTSSQELRNTLLDAQANFMAIANACLVCEASAPPLPSPLHIDLSQFLTDQSPIRIVFWRAR